MNFGREMLVQYISDFFHEEVLKYCLYVLLAVVATIASIYGFKIYTNKAIWKAILIVLLTGVCATSLILIKTKEFIPIYKDYKTMSYTIEQDSEVCIEDGMNNQLDQKYSVVLVTKDGEVVHLKITDDYRFETGKIYRGTVVYTNNSKHIIWYDFL